MPDTHVAFVRAINVAGHAIVKMDAVRDVFSGAGCRRVATVIQSGNIVFDLPARGQKAILDKVRRNLRALIGEEPQILMRTSRDLERMVARAPFKKFDGKKAIKLYVVFLAHAPARTLRLPLIDDQEALEIVAIGDLEVFVVSRQKKNGFFGFPNGFVEKTLGVPATSRNWSTILKMQAVACGDAKA